MKKIIISLVLCLIVLSLTACQGNDHNNGERTGEYLAILQSGSYSLGANSYFEGIHLLMNEYVSGKDYKIIYRNDNDTQFSYLCTDGKVYRLLDGLGYYADAEDYQPPHYFVANMTDYDYSTAVYRSSDTHTMFGESYDYDIYKMKTYEGEEVTLHIYIDSNGSLYALAIPEDALQITVDSLSEGIPDDISLNLPEDYMEIDYSQLESMPEL